LKKILFVLVLVVQLTQIHAAHLVGGVINYKYISKDTYQFTFKVYRDCAGGGAPFDPSVTFGIYDGTTYLKSATVRTYIQNTINPPIFDCFTPPSNVCVEEAVYTFKTTLPKSTKTYTISTLRCCRNNSISNIFNPSTSGATFFVEIAPDAQGEINSSPVFNTFPPTVICLNEPLNFDHSAFDDDGDQMVYEFCAPLLGGGQTGGGCSSTIPTPPCPPPYGTVQFKTPTYTANKPMGGNPLIKIDPITGLITGTPDVQGQYVVGVCVKEYRNGILLSTTQRDFQFNVYDCVRTVFADVQSDSVTSDGSFVVTNCNLNQVKLINKSYSRANINTFFWEFKINGTKVKFTDWEPLINLPDTGVYFGKLYLNPNTKCKDSADVIISIPGKSFAKLDFKFDTCSAGPVTFDNITPLPFNGLKSLNWKIDNLDTSAQNVTYQFVNPGKKSVSLHMEDKLGCTSDTTVVFDWLPAPRVIFIKPDNYILCAPGLFNITNLSRPIDSTYKIKWDFGDGTTSDGQSASHLYKDSGSYSLKIRVTSPIGCVNENTFPNWIKVLSVPYADFDYSPLTITQIKNRVDFTNKSKKANSYNWFFDNKDLDRNENPIYVFQDTGWHTVTLFVRSKSGCIDSTAKNIYVEPTPVFYLPTAFSPNGDGTNEEYRGKGLLTEKNNYKMLIYSPWGEVVFESTDFNQGWNGRLKNFGELLPQGIYKAFVTYNDYNGKRIEFSSNVVLLK
jgi:gliding motility-associated-like protein